MNVAGVRGQGSGIGLRSPGFWLLVALSFTPRALHPYHCCPRGRTNRRRLIVAAARLPGKRETWSCSHPVSRGRLECGQGRDRGSIRHAKAWSRHECPEVRGWGLGTRDQGSGIRKGGSVVPPCGTRSRRSLVPLTRNSFKTQGSGVRGMHRLCPCPYALCPLPHASGLASQTPRSLRAEGL